MWTKIPNSRHVIRVLCSVLYQLSRIAQVLHLLSRLIVPEVLSQAGSENRILCPKCGVSRSRYCCTCLLPIGPASLHPVPLLAPFTISIVQHRCVIAVAVATVFLSCFLLLLCSCSVVCIPFYIVTMLLAELKNLKSLQLCR
jgi:hypothetical protein